MLGNSASGFHKSKKRETLTKVSHLLQKRAQNSSQLTHKHRSIKLSTNRSSSISSRLGNCSETRCPTQSVKGKLDYLEFLKIKTICPATASEKSSRRQEEVFKPHVPRRGELWTLS